MGSLNSEKLKFKQTQVDFFGHVLTENGIQSANKEKLEDASKHERAPDHPGHGDLPQLLFNKGSLPDITLKRGNQKVGALQLGVPPSAGTRWN